MPKPLAGRTKLHQIGNIQRKLLESMDKEGIQTPELSQLAKLWLDFDRQRLELKRFALVTRKPRAGAPGDEPEVGVDLDEQEPEAIPDDEPGKESL